MTTVAWIGVAVAAFVFLASVFALVRRVEMAPALVVVAVASLFVILSIVIDRWAVPVGLAAGLIAGIAVMEGLGRLLAADWLVRLRERQSTQARRTPVDAPAAGPGRTANQAAGGLGAASEEARIAAVYELERTTRDARDMQRLTDVLSACVRIWTREASGNRGREDVRAAMTVLARRPSRESGRKRETNMIDLSGVTLTGLALPAANLSGTTLARANLAGAYLADAQLDNAILVGADLRKTSLRGANLRGANLSGADLSGANLSGADLRGADLSGADLSGADLSGANLHEAGLVSATVDDAVADQTTHWPHGFDPRNKGVALPG